MSFELKHKETVPQGIRRIACEQIEKALEVINGTKRGGSDEAVHEARKCFKQVRGALRLVRCELGDQEFRRENGTFRDAGRPLSQVRDAKVLVDTLDSLTEHFKPDLKPDSFKHLRDALVRRRREVRLQVLEKERAMSKVAKAVKAAEKRVDRWNLRHKGWGAISEGLRLVYGQGRDSMQQALQDGSDEAYHEWRKRGKDLRYDLELLTRVWPEMFNPMAEQAHHLTDLLGEDHDLAVLKQIVEEELDESICGSERELLFGLVDQRRRDLQKEASELGQKLYEESDGDFVDRIHGYWKAW
jgi:CHAD domain-containing protein